MLQLPYLKMNRFIDKIVNGLSSIKTAVILLSLIILICAIGTFIPQGLPHYGYDIYHSRWFIVLLFLLWCSIFICTLKRLKFKPQAFPTIITHLGLLIILAGAFVTGILGEKGFMLIYEKHNQDTYIDADNKFKTLDFKIYLDDFSVKDFRSKVAVIEPPSRGKPAQEILKETIEVNRPLRYKGYSFYQASYDQDNFKWTGLDVVKDPGVPFVWCGFILLNLGVILRFYFRPKVV